MIEVLVALSIMAVLASMAWLGMDGIFRSREISQAQSDQTLRMQAVLAQWEADINEKVTLQTMDGGVKFQDKTKGVAFIRRTDQGLQVVKWAMYGSTWQRWASSATPRLSVLSDYWRQADELLGNESGQLVLAKNINDMSLLCTQSGMDWFPCVKTGNEMPFQAIRLQLVFGEGSGWNGQMTKDLLMPKQPSPRATGQ